MNHFLLHNERINATNARNETHDQDLCAYVGIKITQSFEEVRNYSMCLYLRTSLARSQMQGIWQEHVGVWSDLQARPIES